MYCITCECEVRTRPKITKSSKFYWKHYKNKQYIREACCNCGDDMLLINKEGLYGEDNSKGDKT